MLLAALVLSACAVLGERYEKPELTLVDIRPAESGNLEQRFVLRFRLRNPNPAGLPVRGIRYEVELLGETFASGATGQDFGIAAFGEAEFEVTVGVSLHDAARVAMAAMQSSGECLDYRLDARIATAVPFLGEVRLIRDGAVSSANICPSCRAGH